MNMLFTFLFLFVLLNGLVFLYQAFIHKDKRYLLCVVVCVISLVLMTLGLGYFSLTLS